MTDIPKKKWQRPVLRIHKRAEVDRWLQDASCRCDPDYPNLPGKGHRGCDCPPSKN